MAKSDNLTDFLKGLADKFRAKLSSTAKINPQEFDTKVDEVFEAGERSEYNRFWDKYQNSGGYSPYRGKFYGWSVADFTPKYDINCAGDCERMFCYFGNTDTPFDMFALLESRGVKLDTSKATNMSGVYNGCGAKSIDVIDLTGADRAGDLLRYAHNLVTVGEVKLSTTKKCAIGAGFQDAEKLENIKFTGTIFSQYLGFDNTEKLSHESLLSLLNALEDQSEKGTTSGVALRKANLAKLSDEEKAIAIQKGWSLV